MALLLLADLYALLLPLGFGVWFLKIIDWSVGRRLVAAPVATITVWLGGLALLTVGLEVWSLLGPIHTAAHVAASTVALAGLLHPDGRRLLGRLLARLRRLHWSVQVVAALVLVCSVLVSTLPPLNVDTGFYHAQSVRWLEEMGIVPGLANIELHIGFNPSWFVPEALFSWGRYVGSPLQVLNTMLFSVFGWYGLGGLDNLLRREFEPSDLLRVLLAVAMIFLLDDLPSLSPDPAVVILTYYLIIQGVVLPWPRPGQPLTTAHVAVILLTVFAVTAKLSTAPLLLLPLWWMVRSGQFKAVPFLLKLTALSLAIVAPWLVRNYFISGYLIFPVAAIDIFHPSWKFPIEEVRLHADYIKEFARNTKAYYEISVHNKPMSFWFPLWWSQQNIFNKLIFMALPALLLVMLPLMGWQYRRQRLPQIKPLLLTLLFALAGVGFWFMLAPAFRFGYGFLFATLALLVLPLVWEIVVRSSPRLIASLFALLICAALIGSICLIDFRHYLVPSSLKPTDYATLLERTSAPAERTFLQNQFLPSGDTVFKEKQNRSLLERGKLIMLLAGKGNVHGKTGLDVPMTEPNGEGGLLSLPHHLIRPAAYPVIPVQPVMLGALHVLESSQDQLPWYAPFPFVVRKRMCYALGPDLSDGFGPRIVPGIRDWHKEARW